MVSALPVSVKLKREAFALLSVLLERRANESAARRQNHERTDCLSLAISQAPSLVSNQKAGLTVAA